MGPESLHYARHVPMPCKACLDNKPCKAQQVSARMCHQKLHPGWFGLLFCQHPTSPQMLPHRANQWAFGGPVFNEHELYDSKVQENCWATILLNSCL